MTPSLSQCLFPNPGLLAGPSDLPASPFLRDRSGVENTGNPRSGRMGERRPYAFGRDSVAGALAEGSQARFSSGRRHGREVCPVKKAVTGTPVGEGRSRIPADPAVQGPSLPLACPHAEALR